MSIAKRNSAFHDRLALLIGTEEPFRWAKRMGIPSATFARIWSGNSIPKHEHLCRIAERCEVSLDWLLMGRGEMSFNTVSGGNVLSALIPVVELANCGLEQGWYNEADLQCSIVVPASLKEEGSFGVLCRGKSMEPAGIHDGAVAIIHPNRPPAVGKPALIRTRVFIKGHEACVSTIKRYDGKDADSVKLAGWLNPDETGEQSCFYEKRSLSCIVSIAPVGTVLENAGLPADTDSKAGTAEVPDRELLKKCFNALKPVFETMDSDKFTELFLLVYEEALKSGKIDLDIVMRLVRIIGGKP